MSGKSFQHSAENKLLGLEIMRFFSAISILILHYQNFGYISVASTNFIREQQPLFSFLKIFYNYGYLGVYVFFCISGFIFSWKYRETISNKTFSGKKFFIARFARLYPLHLLTLILVAVLQLLYFGINNDYFMYKNNDLYHFILQLFMAHDWGLQKGVSFNAPTWSISVEILVYALFFLILRYVSKSILINIILIIACLAAKKFNIPYSTHAIVSCVALFYIGGISAIILKAIGNTKYKFFFNIISIFTIIFVPIIIWQFEIYTFENFIKIFIFLYTPALLYIFSQNIRVKPFLQKSIETAGNLTYSSYLIHIPFQILITIFFSLINKQIPIYNVVFFFSYLFLTLIISYFSFNYFEAPARKFIRLKFSD